mgnify:CR=1 FL=1|jgi:DNA-binding transcriptional regulator YiaG|nr:helix-turn-helix domain-containing protein [uncultured Desulfovibrio sp.]
MMSKAQELIRQMMEDPTGDMMRPVRKSLLISQKDGSIVRKMVDKNGVVISEETISNEQRLSLDARIRLGMSQQQFAKMLGISVRTLHDWEQGRREPSGAAKTLLYIAARHPDIVQEIVEQRT